jgi:hypothetical protein
MDLLQMHSDYGVFPVERVDERWKREIVPIDKQAACRLSVIEYLMTVRRL